MDIIIGFVVIIGVLLLARRAMLIGKANGILRRSAEELSQKSGIATEKIYEEMLAKQMTPGDWARAHNLDPTPFEPQD